MLPTNTPTQGEERGVSVLAWVLHIPAPILGPAIVYAVYAGRSKFVAYHAMQSLLLQVTVMALGVVGFVLTVVTLGLGAILVVPALVIVGVLDFVLMVVFGIKAANGEWGEIPFVSPWARKIVGV